MPSETVINIVSTQASEAPATTTNGNPGTGQTPPASRNNNGRNFSDFGVQATMSKCSLNRHATSNESVLREDCPPPGGTGNVLLIPTAPEAPSPQDERRSALTSYLAQPLVYMKDYPIRRYSRHWRRQEVQGLSCLLMEIITLTIWLALTLKVLGYVDYTEDGVIPNTFSRKILAVYVTQTPMEPVDRNCLFVPFNEQIQEEFTKNDDPLDLNPKVTVLASKPKTRFRRADCDYWKNIGASDWLYNLLQEHIFSIINVITASIFLCSLSARRQKGLQVFLLLPSFLCFFMNIFKTIPSAFSHGSLKDMLRDAMYHSIEHSNPSKVMPVWAETQMHLQCCGINYPEIWEDREGFIINGYGYPSSCCNTTAFYCDGQRTIHRNQTWSVGCYKEESERLHNYERWGLLLVLFKIVSEIGIFCALSDLTRYEYPPAALVENSYCEVKDYRVRCRGAMRLRGVTKDGRVVVEAKYLMPWRLEPSRTDLLTGVSLYIKTSLNQVKGSVQIDKRQNADTFLSEDIQIDLSRRHRGMFVFSLF